MKSRGGATLLLALILVIGILSVLAACATTKQELSETNENTDSGYLLENMGYAISLPDGYRDKVTLLPSNELDSNIIIALIKPQLLKNTLAQDFCSVLYGIPRRNLNNTGQT